MLEFMMQADVFGNALIPPVISIVAFTALIAVIWNISRKFTTLELDAKTGKEQHFNDIARLENKINEFDKNLVKQISDAKVERKEEISKALGNSVDRYEGLQRQIDGVRSDVKDQSSRITTVITKADFIEKQIKELKECDEKNMQFVTDWNQRIEDRIEAAIKWIKEIMTFLLGRKSQMGRTEESS